MWNTIVILKRVGSLIYAAAIEPLQLESLDILIILTVLLKFQKMCFESIFLCMDALWKVLERYVDILKSIQLDLDVKFRIKIHIYSIAYTSERSKTRHMYNIQRKCFLLFL